jgi:predicted amidophosphoribosyltransferase
MIDGMTNDRSVTECMDCDPAGPTCHRCVALLEREAEFASQCAEAGESYDPTCGACAEAAFTGGAWGPHSCAHRERVNLTITEAP